MSKELEENASDWIDFKFHKPATSGYYEVTCCPDPENVIKWDMAAFCEDDALFYTISTLTNHGKNIKVVRLWRKHKPKCT